MDAEELNNRILDWLIWKIMLLQNTIKSHRHSSPFDVYGMCANAASYHDSDNIYIKKQKISNEIKSTKATIDEFDEIKKSILETQCPIIELRKKYIDLQQQLEEIEK